MFWTMILNDEAPLRRISSLELATPSAPRWSRMGTLLSWHLSSVKRLTAHFLVQRPDAFPRRRRSTDNGLDELKILYGGHTHEFFQTYNCAPPTIPVHLKVLEQSEFCFAALSEPPGPTH